MLKNLGRYIIYKILLNNRFDYQVLAQIRSRSEKILIFWLFVDYYILRFNLTRSKKKSII